MSFYTEGMRATLTVILTGLIMVLSGVPAVSLEAPHVSPATGTSDPLEADPAVPQLPPSPAHLEVVAADPLLEPGSEEYAFTVRLTPASDEPLEAGQAEVSILMDVLTHPDDLDAPHVTAESRHEVLATFDTPALDVGDSFETQVAVSGDDFPLTTLNIPGVYLTAGTWSGDQFTVFNTSVPHVSTPFVWNGEAMGSTLGLASIIPVTYPSVETPPTTPAEVNEQLESQRALQRLLPAAEAADSLLAIDPRIIAYVRSLGASASPEARELVDVLTAAETDSFALKYADADPLMLTLLGESGDLNPTGLSYLTRYFTSATQQVESDFAHPRDDLETDSLTDGSVPPSLNEMLEWETPLTNFAWPASGAASQHGLTALAQAGYSQIVLSGEEVAGSAKGMYGEMTVYHSDADIEAASRGVLLASGDIELATARADLAAITALQGSLSTAEVPAQSLLAVDRELAATAESLDPLIAELEGLPWVRFIPASELQLGTVELTEEHNVEPAVASLARAVENEPEVIAYSRVLEEPQLLIDYQRDRLLSAFSVQRPLTATDADLIALDERINAHLAGDARLLEGVHIVDTEHTRLLGTVSNIPLQFRNTLPFDARVVGTISTGTAALIVEHPRLGNTTIPAESTINELTTVHSRAASGEVELSVRLRDTHVGDDVDHIAFRVTLSGQTETIALSTLGVIIVALFTGGIWRSVARKRSARGTRTA